MIHNDQHEKAHRAERSLNSEGPFFVNASASPN